MRGKDYNTGLRGVLFEARHYERMGAAVWLYGWLVLRQTHQQASVGWVLGGAPVSYREIEEETGFNARTLERWMQVLRRAGYIETQAAPGGVIISITKAKKFPQGLGKIADGARRFAGRLPQSRGADWAYPSSNLQVAEPIRSSSIGRSQERDERRPVRKDFHKMLPSCGNSSFRKPGTHSLLEQTTDLSQFRPAESSPEPQAPASAPLDARLLRQLLRAEREEAVRRELAVGTGPEVRRP